METPSQQNGSHFDGAGRLPQANELESMIAQFKSQLATMQAMAGEAQQSLVTINSAQAQAQAALNEAEAKLATITEAASTALQSRTAIVDTQSVIAAKSQHIEDARVHADTVRAELDLAQIAAKQAATDAEGNQARAKATSDQAAEALTAIKGLKAQAEADVTDIAAARETAQKAAAVLKSLSDTAESVAERIAAYESTLKDFETRSNAQLDTITGLLPGATSAGLAHAFTERGKLFKDPGKRWQWLFVGSVVMLAGLAGIGLWQVVNAVRPLDFSELLRFWLARLPFTAALIWLALHSSREAALAKRLEEDYGYKATIAASFQGFQKQMAEIGTGAPAGSALVKLCDDTLATIASPPGRIYEKHKLTVSPASEIAGAARAITEAVGEAATGKRTSP